MKYLSCIVLAASLGVSGCSVLPKAGPLAGKDVAEIDNSIIDGKTTSAELRAIYGDKPTMERTAQGKIVQNWYRTWSAGFTQDTTVLSVLTDNDIAVKHTVLRYKTSNSYSFVSKLSEAELQAFIIPGKTTRQEIEQKYGKPNDNSFDDEGNRILLYVYADASRSKYSWIPNVGGYIEALTGSVNTKVNVLQIPLDNRGVVVSYRLKMVNYRQGIGFLNASGVEEVK